VQKEPKGQPRERDNAMTEFHYNQSIKELLRSIAELKEAEGPVELCCMWFDDLYFPAHTRPQGMSIEVFEKGQREWKSCFSNPELEALAKFHTVFEREKPKLSMEQPSVWRSDEHWLVVAQAAKHALERFHPAK
jgi:hypothetical protein